MTPFRQAVLVAAAAWGCSSAAVAQIGREVSVARHLKDGEETRLAVKDLVEFGGKLFSANWTPQEGGGRPLTKGTGKALSDPSSPLGGARAFNRISGPDANSCAGCHNMPFGVAGGSGDFVSSVFVLGQRFDFATLDPADAVATRGGRDESGKAVTLQTAANLRATTGMFGSGYLEMLTRQMTAELQAIRDAMAPGTARRLTAKGIGFGTLARWTDGRWDASAVEGLSAGSTDTQAGTAAPSLIIKPWHQAGAVVSLREFTNNAFNHHHGIQTAERFGAGADPDGDGVVNEMTRADVTAATLYQAAMAAPGRVIPNDPAVEAAVLRGEALFREVGCAGCHVESLVLDRGGWIFTEPNPYNPAGNLRPGEAETVRMDLNSADLPQPRLPMHLFGVVTVPAYTDFKLHDMCGPEPDPAREALDMQQPAGSAGFFAGNCRFLTKRLWDAANSPPYCRHGFFTTLRQAVEGHAGEGLDSRRRYGALPAADQDAVIEFLKTLQVLPPGTQSTVVDENYKPKGWPPVR